MTPPFIRNHYNYDTRKASDDAVVHVPLNEESLTIQSQTEDADINKMIERFGIGHKMPENHRIPQYGDWTHITDYATAIDAISQAQEHFMAMPANVRAQFQNNPQIFLDFCSNPGNIEEMRKLGLAVPRETSGEPPLTTQPNSTGATNPAPSTSSTTTTNATPGKP